MPPCAGPAGVVVRPTCWPPRAQRSRLVVQSQQQPLALERALSGLGDGLGLLAGLHIRITQAGPTASPLVPIRASGDSAGPQGWSQDNALDMTPGHRVNRWLDT